MLTIKTNYKTFQYFEPSLCYILNIWFFASFEHLLAQVQYGEICWTAHWHTCRLKKVWKSSSSSPSSSPSSSSSSPPSSSYLSSSSSSLWSKLGPWANKSRAAIQSLKSSIFYTHQILKQTFLRIKMSIFSAQFFTRIWRSVTFCNILQLWAASSVLWTPRKQLRLPCDPPFMIHHHHHHHQSFSSSSIVIIIIIITISLLPRVRELLSVHNIGQRLFAK